MSKRRISSLCASPEQPQAVLRRHRNEFARLSQRGVGRIGKVHTLFVQWWHRFPLSALLRGGERENPRFPASVPGVTGLPGDSPVIWKESDSDAVPAAEESAPAVAEADFLCEWVKSGALLRLIMDVAQTLEWPESELKLAASTGYAFRRQALLSVVTYCYATGVRDSKQIAQKIAREEILRFLCAGTVPTWNDVRHFAHENRDLIKQSLIRTCELARVRTAE